METQWSNPSEPVEMERATLRKSLRPVLIVSAQNLREHAPFLGRLLVGMADESIPVALICPPGFDTESVAPAPAALFTHPLVPLPLMEHMGIDRLTLQLERFRPTVLHCLCESRAALTRQIARRLDLPYVIMVNSLAAKVRRLPLSSHRCARIVVPAETIHGHVSRALPRFADRVVQVNMGSFVDTDMMCFSNPSRLPSVVVAYPLRRAWHFANFFKAIKSLRADNREFMVAVMGTGPAEHALRRMIETLGLSDMVTLVPILNPWRSVVAAGDIFVQPQPLRGFSSFLLEAMAVGTAVAACEGGVDDLIVPNQTALTFEPNSEPSIRQAIKQLLDDHDCARRLAATAQEHVREKYSVSTMVSATVKTYVEALQFRSQPCA